MVIIFTQKYEEGYSSHLYLEAHIFKAMLMNGPQTVRKSQAVY